MPDLPVVDLAVQHRLRQQLNVVQRADHYFYIDVVGSCNLRCPSCPVGNSAPVSAKGLMSIGVFRETLAKIRAEHPEQRLMAELYNWGDPSLHPELAALVRLSHEFKLQCGLSSNLNVFPNMREVVKENPDYIRVSLSGYFNDAYRTTHRGGDINAVKANLYLLRHLLDRYRATTIVQVGFHIYRSNFPRDFLKIRELCDELGFLFDPVIASFMPAEKAVAAVAGVVEEADRRVVADLVISPKRWHELYEAEGIRFDDCQYRKDRTTINFDGSVSLCCAVYGADKVVATNFLSVTQSELQQRKYAHDFCKTCMSRSMHQLFTGIPVAGAHNDAGEILGPLYEAFERENKMIGNLDFVVLENRFCRVDAIYEAGIAALSRGDAGVPEAEKHFALLTEQAPRFGEGFFQAARLASRHGDTARAIALMETAVQTTPEHALYKRELEEMRSRFGEAAL